jgi:hypothetical protein
MRKAPMLTLLPLVQIALLVACGPEPAQRVLAPSAELAARSQSDDDDRDSEGDPRFSGWSAAVNLGPVVNSASEDAPGSISRDGLSLYLSSPRPAVGNTGNDIWVSRRVSVNAPWESPENLGPTVNAPGSVNDQAPTVSLDGHRLFFVSNRPGGFGGNDIYVSRRRDKRDDFGWEAPVNLGGEVNTAAGEGGPAYFEDEATGTITLFFQSGRPGGLGGNDIYASTLLPDGTFGAPVLVRELSSPFNDQRPTIRRDGLEIFLASDRPGPGTLGGMDIWVATRASTSDPWSTPVNLGPAVNSVNFDGGPALSFDATTLYFTSANRPENVGGPRFDIWMTTREKLKGRHED